MAATPAFHYCVELRKPDKQYEELYKQPPIPSIIIARIGLNGACLGHVFRIEHDVIEALAAVLSGVFSLILTISTVLLWKETRRLAIGAETQSKDMRDSIAEAARSATAMENTERAASRQTIIMSEQTKVLAATLEATQIANVALNRAYVYMVLVSENCGKWFSGFDDKLIIVWQAKNFGSTPAKMLNMIGRAYVGSGYMPYTGPEPHDDYFGKIIIANQDSTDEFHVPLKGERPTAQIRSDLALGNSHIYFSGLITYEDVFRQFRTTQWCFRYGLQKHMFSDGYTPENYQT